MVHSNAKDMDLLKAIQNVLLNDSDSLRVLVPENLQKILTSEFARKYRRRHMKGEIIKKDIVSSTLKTQVGTL